ncbi:hypothetical protein MDOR_21180 [Mycolicibacterium doricum]|uniref:Uncharacterized protein n=1 Tax=Mycolicibacterium doricum TaxID=126673 RepID=A0A7I7VRN7_9MYCO|nr:hypothetical protein MDOR_21180 [Mycolicibacterium doricum]
MRPKTDEVGRLLGLQWGSGFVVVIAVPAASGIKARRKAKTVMRQSRSARTSTTEQPTAIAA